MKYQSSNTHCLKVISKVKVFKKWVKLHCQDHKVKNNGNNRKVLSKGIFLCNIKALALTVKNLYTRLKFSKKWVQLQGQGPREKNNGTNEKVLSHRHRIFI